MRLIRSARRSGAQARSVPSLPLVGAGVAAGILLVAPGEASAYKLESESTRSTYMEVKLGPFKPNIDAQFSGDPAVRPYQRIFSANTATMVSLSIERHLLADVGTLSMGLGAGYWNISGRGISDGAEDTTELTVVPFQLQVSYRLDLWQELVPLIPQVRAGLDYVWWQIFDGQGDVTDFTPGKPAEGGTWGWHVSAGLLLSLDFFDPEMAADFDRDAGVNSSYLLFEVQYSQVDDFGGGGSLRFGNTTFFGGLALDM